jgi:tetratricopeptide (TPR) repeat protein
MKVRIFSLFFLIYFLPISKLHCQDYLQDDFLLAKKNWLEVKDKDALEIFNAILANDSLTKFNTILAQYYIGCIYFSIKKFDESEKYFLTITKTNISSEALQEKSWENYPYLRLMHNAFDYLTHICIELKRYREALKYLKLADKSFPFFTDKVDKNSKEYIEHSIYLAKSYAECYKIIGQRDSAIYVLLPFTFYSASNNPMLIESVATLIKSHYSKDEINNELNKAKESIKLIKLYKSTNIREYAYNIILKLFNQDIVFDNIKSVSRLSNLEIQKRTLRYKNKFEETIFYKELVGYD